MCLVPFNWVESSSNPAEADKTGSQCKKGFLNASLHRTLSRPFASPSTWRSPSSQGRESVRADGRRSDCSTTSSDLPRVLEPGGRRVIQRIDTAVSRLVQTQCFRRFPREWFHDFRLASIGSTRRPAIRVSQQTPCVTLSVKVILEQSAITFGWIGRTRLRKRQKGHWRPFCQICYIKQITHYIQ